MAVVEEKKDVATKDAVKKAPKKAAKKASVEAAPHADIAYRTLIEPWITEKSHSAMSANKYTFKVVRTADKKALKKAIEGMYKVVVEHIAVVNVKAKKRAYGRYEGKKAGFKKAIVTLKEGDKIEFFQGA